MGIGIIGTGKIGKALAAHLTKAGYAVVVSNSRGPTSLVELERQLGQSAKAGTREEAAQQDPRGARCAVVTGNCSAG